MPVVIKGIDANGRSFIEHSHTLLVNRAGFKTVSKQPLARGNRIQIAVPSRQRVSWATVAWLGEQKTDGQEVGIALEQATDDFWGVEFPVAALITLDHENGTVDGNGSARDGSRNASSNGRPASAEKLSGALQELAQLAIEEALERALKNFQARTEETQSRQAGQFAAQLQDRVEQALSAARERLDTQVAELLSNRQRDWERNIQSLGDSIGEAVSERMRTRRAEQEDLLGARAERICRELSEKLSAASRLLSDTHDRPA
jgi:hypothetical protein